VYTPVPLGRVQLDGSGQRRSGGDVVKPPGGVAALVHPASTPIAPTIIALRMAMLSLMIGQLQATSGPRAAALAAPHVTSLRRHMPSTVDTRVAKVPYRADRGASIFGVFA
jgi:hypothetical protein